MLLLFTACIKDDRGANQIFIEKDSFEPSLIYITTGSTITWINKVNVTHTVTSDDGLFESGSMDKGKIYTFTFTNAGSYEYHCSIHNGMKGTVVVR
jgi:plastocyanin